MTKLRLYLDVDGVLNAFRADKVWPRVQKFYVKQDFAEYKIVYAPALIKALDEFIAEFDVELVWLTTWNENRSVLTSIVPKIGGLARGRILGSPTRETWHSWKAHALALETIFDPMPFIWIDDVEVDFWGKSIEKSNPDLPRLMIDTDMNFGITPEHIKKMREFAKMITEVEDVCV